MVQSAKHGTEFAPAIAATTSATGSLSMPHTNKELIGTAFYAHSADLLAKDRRRAGQYSGRRDVQRVDPRYIKTAFGTKYFNQTHRSVHEPNASAPTLLALQFNLLPEALRPEGRAVARERRDRARGTNSRPASSGWRICCPASRITANSRLPTSCFSRTPFHRGFSSVKQGATTIWERWDGWTPDRRLPGPRDEFLQPLFARKLRRVDV